MPALQGHRPGVSVICASLTATQVDTRIVASIWTFAEALYVEAAGLLSAAAGARSDDGGTGMEKLRSFSMWDRLFDEVADYSATARMHFRREVSYEISGAQFGGIHNVRVHVDEQLVVSERKPTLEKAFEAALDRFTMWRTTAENVQKASARREKAVDHAG